MCGGGKFGSLFKNSGISGLGKNLRDYVEKQKAESAEASPEAQQTKDDNAAQAVRKRRASEVLSATDNGKKKTLGG